MLANCGMIHLTITSDLDSGLAKRDSIGPGVPSTCGKEGLVCVIINAVEYC